MVAVLQATELAVLAEHSSGSLFIAGIIPGFVKAAAFVIMIMLMARFTPGLVFNLKRQTEVWSSGALASPAAGLS